VSVSLADRDPHTWSQLQKVARQLVSLQRQVNRLADTPALSLSAIEGGAIDGYTTDGQLTTRTGEQHDGTFVSVSLAGPTPPAPTVPILDAGPGLANIAWDGGFVDDALTPMDFSRVEVYVSSSPITDPLPAFLIGTIETPQGAEVVTRREAGLYYVRLATRSASGKVSALSEQATVTIEEQVDPEAIAEQIASKTSIYRHTTDPVESGTAVGDLWWKLDGAGAVIGQWTWDGDSWEVLPISGVLIAAETIAAAQIATASLTADKFVAGTLTARELALGIFRSQRVANPGFEITHPTGPAKQGSYLTIPGWTMEAGANGTAWAFEYKQAVAAYSGFGKAVLTNNGAGDVGVTMLSDRFPVNVGEQLNATVMAMSTTTARAGVGVWIRFYDAAGAVISTPSLFVGYVEGSGNAYAPVFTTAVTVPAAAVTGRLMIQNRRSVGSTGINYLLIDDVAVFPVGVDSMDLSPSAFRMWNSLNGSSPSVDITATWAKFPNLEAQNGVINGDLNVTGTLSSQDSFTAQYASVSQQLTVKNRRIEPFVRTIATNALGRAWWPHGLGATPAGVMVVSAMDTVGGPTFPVIGVMERVSGDVPTNATNVAIRLMGNSNSAWGAVTAGTWTVAGFYIV
jgi:hypothetical protein